MVIMANDIIAIYFNKLNPLNVFVSVSLSKIDSGGTAIRIPGSEWYLEASMQSDT